MTNRNVFTKTTSTVKRVLISLRSAIATCLTIALLCITYPLKSYISDDVIKQGKKLEQAITQWSDATGSKTIFTKAKDPTPTNRVKNVFDGDIFFPETTITRTKIDPKTRKPMLDPTTKKPQTETITTPRLAWTNDLRAIQTFIKTFAPKSDVLSKAWSNVVAADQLIQVMLKTANEKKQLSPQCKISFFATKIPVLTNMLNSLSASLKSVKDTRMWFYDTEASKGLMLATIPIISAALSRIITDFTQLQQTQPRGAQKTDDCNQPALDQESASLLEKMKSVHGKRGQPIVLEYAEEIYVEPKEEKKPVKLERAEQIQVLPSEFRKVHPGTTSKWEDLGGMEPKKKKDW